MRRRIIAVVTAALAGASAAVYGTPALADQTRDDQWHLKFLRVAEAQRLSTGRGVTVAVIDSGVANHSDLSGSVLDGTDLIEQGGNGRHDLTGHGSSIAGLIAAHGGNGRGALGIAPNAKILPVRVLGTRRGNVDYGAAVRFAISHGAKVINISISGGIQPDGLTVFEEAEAADVVVVAAAGNRPSNVSVSAPAFLESVVAVGAVDRSGKRAKISVTGDALDITAPGEDMTSTNNKGGYIVGQKGTSDASAIVAGAAALLRSKYPSMSAAEVIDRLESTATDKGVPGVDDEYGHGIVNIVAALADSSAGGTSSPPASGSVPTVGTTSTTPSAASDTAPASSNIPLIVGGVAVIALLGGLAAFLVARRRSSGER